MGGELLHINVSMFFLGLTNGLTVCGWSCLPYIGPYIMGYRRGFGSGIQSVLLFSLGKIVSYACLGALAGYLGSVVSGYSGFAPTIAALVIVWLGCSMFFRSKGECGGRNNKEVKQPHLIILGLIAGLMPCLPLSGVLLYAASGNSVINGCWTAVLFGLGTTISPLIFIGGAMGWLSAGISRKIPRYSGLFQKICGLMLVSFGIKLLILS